MAWGAVHLPLPPDGSRQVHCFLGLATGLEGARAGVRKDGLPRRDDGELGTSCVGVDQRQGPGRCESSTAG